MEKKRKDQGHLIVVNGGGGTAYRKWRRHGWETLMVYKVRKRSAMVRSLRELEWREEKGEERGFAR